jgi:hypothetical protein
MNRSPAADFVVFCFQKPLSEKILETSRRFSKVLEHQHPPSVASVYMVEGMAGYPSLLSLTNVKASHYTISGDPGGDF